MRNLDRNEYEIKVMKALSRFKTLSTKQLSEISGVNNHIIINFLNKNLDRVVKTHKGRDCYWSLR